MLKTPLRSGVVVAGLVVVLVFDLVVGGILGAVLGPTLFANRNTTPGASAPHTKTSPSQTTVTIAQGQGLFEPFILAVAPNTTVTWQNNDTVAHTIVTTPDQTPFLNLHAFSLTVAAGQRAGFKLVQPGLYHYYDPTMAAWNRADARVAANKGVPNFPLAMDGVIWVKGAISNLPSATTNRIPPSHDDFVSEFLAITPGSVSWHNFDSDPHFVALVPGWSAISDPPQVPADINPTDIGVNRIAGTDDVPGGDTITVIFSKPGLYYYYCVNHAHIDAATHRAEAFKGASEYPIPMEGFLLVSSS
jgi:plastocyanin